MRNKPTRFYSDKQEKAVAKAIKGKQQSNSGATTWQKGDVENELFLIECKTSTTIKKSFTIQKEWLEKLREEAFGMRKEQSALCFDFGDGDGRYYVISERLFQQLNELLKEDV